MHHLSEDKRKTTTLAFLVSRAEPITTTEHIGHSRDLWIERLLKMYMWALVGHSLQGSPQ